MNQARTIDRTLIRRYGRGPSGDGPVFMVSLDRGIRYSILTLVMHGELVVQMGFHRGVVVVGFVVRLEGPSLNSSAVSYPWRRKISTG
jgi:hypothetical protein